MGRREEELLKYVRGVLEDIQKGQSLIASIRDRAAEFLPFGRERLEDINRILLQQDPDLPEHLGDQQRVEDALKKAITALSPREKIPTADLGSLPFGQQAVGFFSEKDLPEGVEVPSSWESATQFVVAMYMLQKGTEVWSEVTWDPYSSRKAAVMQTLYEAISFLMSQYDFSILQLEELVLGGKLDLNFNPDYNEISDFFRGIIVGKITVELGLLTAHPESTTLREEWEKIKNEVVAKWPKLATKDDATK